MYQPCRELGGCCDEKGQFVWLGSVGRDDDGGQEVCCCDKRESE